MRYRLYVRRYAPFGSFGLAFEGDHRAGPSVSLSDTARTIGEFIILRTGISSPRGWSSGTRMVGPGAALGSSTASVSATIRSSAPIARGFRASLHTAGANPMVPGAPDIDTFVDISFSWGIGELVISGEVRGDNFPNAEIFLLDAAGNPALLFDFRTGGGRNTGPFTRLAGSHERQTLGSINTRIPLDRFGNFTASMTAKTIRGR
jgi:hypothetical protein